MCRAGKLRREADLSKPTVTWYRLEEAARVYLDRRPDRIRGLEYEPDYEAYVPGAPVLQGWQEPELEGPELAPQEPMPTDATSLASTQLGAEAAAPETLTALLVQLAQTQRETGVLLQTLVEQRNLGVDREEQIAELNDKIADLNDAIRRRNDQANRELREVQDKLAARTKRLMELIDANAGLQIALARATDEKELLAAQVKALSAQPKGNTAPSDPDAPNVRLSRRRKTGPRHRL